MRQSWVYFSETFSLRQNCLVSPPPTLRYGLSRDLVTIIILCSFGNSYCTFGFLIFIIIERNFLYYSLYILTEKSLKHLCSIRAWIPVSFFLFLSLFLPPSSFLFHFLIVNSRLLDPGPSKDPNKWCPEQENGIHGISDRVTPEAY